MHIIHYPHLTLRHKSKPIRRVDAELREIVTQMFDLMYQAKGVGLAANQVNLPIRLFVANLKADPKTGEELVFINPVLSNPKGSAEQEEGCLSLPELYGNVRRPEKITIHAYNLKGEEIRGEISGMLARVVQHETDHLDGVLFTDRLTTGASMTAREELADFEAAFTAARRTGEIPSDEEIQQQIREWEEKYC